MSTFDIINIQINLIEHCNDDNMRLQHLYDDIIVENGDSDPLDDGYGYGTRLNTVGRAERLSESCDIPTLPFERA